MWLEFPVSNPMDKGHFLKPTQWRTNTDSKNNSLDKILEIITDSRRNSKDITRLAEAKVIYYAYEFSESKIREIVSCDVCNSLRCIYSNKTVGEPNGPRKIQSYVLYQWTENGYIFGNEVTVEVLYVHRKLSCGDNVETHLYNPYIGIKGGIIVTKWFCCILLWHKYCRQSWTFDAPWGCE